MVSIVDSEYDGECVCVWTAGEYDEELVKIMGVVWYGYGG